MWRDIYSKQRTEKKGLNMCLFHKWVEVQKGIIPVSVSSILFKRESEEKRIISIKQCKRCGKKRAYLYSPFYLEDKQEIDVFYAENVLSKKD